MVEEENPRFASEHHSNPDALKARQTIEAFRNILEGSTLKPERIERIEQLVTGLQRLFFSLGYPVEDPDSPTQNGLLTDQNAIQNPPKNS